MIFPTLPTFHYLLKPTHSEKIHHTERQLFLLRYNTSSTPYYRANYVIDYILLYRTITFTTFVSTPVERNSEDTDIT